jgi:beta-1,4-mannosyl-glycoprotein beta-1,4-N-acetylglucosaminyltransferase
MIVDCFPFFDELDLLEIRLHELQDVVDVFVLTESPYTFTGIEKPLHFQENKERFGDFVIIHTVYVPTDTCTPMEYEVRQKQYNLDCAFDIMRKGYILAHGDVDEIPKASVLNKVINDEWDAARLVMDLFYYYMNCKSTTKKEYKNTRLVRYSDKFNYVQSQRFQVDQVYYNAGWHFSFLGDIQRKIASWGHAPEYNKPPFNNLGHISKCKEQGLDLFRRKGSNSISFEFIKDDLSYLTQYVLDNMGKFEQ